MEETKQKQKTVPTVMCQSKVPIRELVTQVANALSLSQNVTNQVLILGKASTISKAVSVCEIVKRPFQDLSDGE